MPGFKSYLKVQVSIPQLSIGGVHLLTWVEKLSEAVAVICGIALELRDEGCQIVSAQCLYGGEFCSGLPPVMCRID